MVKEGAGLLAVIEGNAAAAVLSAVPTGVYADCANAGVTFVLRQMDRRSSPTRTGPTTNTPW